MTEALLFDCNGVIVDDEEQHRQAMTVVLAAEGIALTRREYYAHHLGFDDRTSFVEAFHRANRTLTPELLERLVAAKSHAYLDLISHSFTLVPGVVEFVRRAAARFRLAMVSGAPRQEVDLVLDGTGLRAHFEMIVTSEDVALGKPDPAGYLAACAALAVQRPLAARDCLVIEDSLPGLEAARVAGMRCAMLTTSLNSRLLRGAHLVWASFEGHDPAEFL
ncbi:MAG: HAD family phosphatase [Gemmatimonadetes bacterium]|nr:HAD family phosphatase [Gemmatimonadota bacterium]